MLEIDFKFRKCQYWVCMYVSWAKTEQISIKNSRKLCNEALIEKSVGTKVEGNWI